MRTLTPQERREWAGLLRTINTQDMTQPHRRAAVIKKVEELADLLDPPMAESEAQAWADEIQKVLADVERRSRKLR